MPGCDSLSFTSDACTSSRTSSSSAPRERDSAKPTTGLPSSNAVWVMSAAPSVMRAMADRRTARPSGKAML